MLYKTIQSGIALRNKRYNTYFLLDAIAATKIYFWSWGKFTEK
jgi:hypothetical protein